MMLMIWPEGRSLARSCPLFARRLFLQPTVILTSLLKEQDFGRHDSVESLWNLPQAHGPTAKEGMALNRTAAGMKDLT